MKSVYMTKLKHRDNEIVKNQKKKTKTKLSAFLPDKTQLRRVQRSDLSKHTKQFNLIKKLKYHIFYRCRNSTRAHCCP